MLNQVLVGTLPWKSHVIGIFQFFQSATILVGGGSERPKKPCTQHFEAQVSIHSQSSDFIRCINLKPTLTPDPVTSCKLATTGMEAPLPNIICAKFRENCSEFSIPNIVSNFGCFRPLRAHISRTRSPMNFRFGYISCL